MKVSFIIPMYGVAPYIEQCARSLFDQTLESCEFIFVDDSSPDNSSEILMELVSCEFSHMQERITLVRHASNLGLPESRNTALKVAKGDFVIFVDSDDWVDPELAEELLIEQVISDADVVSSNFYDVVNGKKTLHKSPFIGGRVGSLNIIASQSFAIQNRVWGMLIRRSLLEKNKLGFCPQITMGEDFLFTVQLIHMSHRITHISKPLYYYRLDNGGSIMNNLSKSRKIGYLRTAWRVREYLQNQPDSNEYRWAIKLQRLNLRKWLLLRSPRRSHPATFVLRLYALIINTFWMVYAYLRG